MRRKKVQKTSGNFDAIILIRIPKWLKDKMRRIAKSKGLSLSALTRMLLIEGIKSVKV